MPGAAVAVGMAADPSTPRFEISHEEPTPEVVVAGFSQFGLAGLTAVDYLTDRLELPTRGHVAVDGLPTITPFEDGRPRHHTQLYPAPDLGLTVLVGELFVPVYAAGPFGECVLRWVEESGVEEVVVLSGIPIAHAPDDHRTFYVATDDYRERRLDGTDVPPMGNGFLDGVEADLVERGLDTGLRVGVYVTPVHARTPDVEAAIRLLETVTDVYDIDVDVGPLEEFAEDVTRYYSELQNRLAAEAEKPRRAKPEDRMYM